MGIFAQQTPPSRPRSGSSFTQIDDYLSVIKRLGIPTADSDVLDGLTSGPNAAKIVYNTTLNKLRVYNPVTVQWRDAIEADLTNYYTKAEVDALIQGLNLSGFVELDKPSTGNELIFGSANGNQNLNISGNSINLKAAIPEIDYTSRFQYEGSMGQLQINVDQSGNYQESTLNANQISGVLFSPTSYAQYMYGIGGFGFHRSTNDYTRGFGIRLPESGNTALHLTTPLTGTTTPVEKVLPISVNGQFADASGNITVPTSSGNFVKADNLTNITSGFRLTSPQGYSFRFIEPGSNVLETAGIKYMNGVGDGIHISKNIIRGTDGTNDYIHIDNYGISLYPAGRRSAKIMVPFENSAYVYLPEKGDSYPKVLTTSVNGVDADKLGNITLPVTTSDLQSTVNIGNTSDREIVITGRGGVNPAINGLHLLVDGVGRMDRPTIFGVVNNQRSSWIGLGEVLTFNVLKELGAVKSLTLDPMKGLVYGSDMSSVYTDRSLVDKAYVDNRVQLVTLRGAISGGVAVLDGGPVQTGHRYLVQGACLYSLSGYRRK